MGGMESLLLVFICRSFQPIRDFGYAMYELLDFLFWLFTVASVLCVYSSGVPTNVWWISFFSELRGRICCAIIIIITIFLTCLWCEYSVLSWRWTLTDDFTCRKILVTWFYAMLPIHTIEFKEPRDLILVTIECRFTLGERRRTRTPTLFEAGLNRVWIECSFDLSLDVCAEVLTPMAGLLTPMRVKTMLVSSCLCNKTNATFMTLTLHHTISIPKEFVGPFL